MEDATPEAGIGLWNEEEKHMQEGALVGESTLPQSHIPSWDEQVQALQTPMDAHPSLTRS